MSLATKTGDPTAELGTPSEKRASFFGQFGISYHSIQACAAVADAFSIVLASLLGGALYHALYYDNLGAVDLFTGVGVANSLIFLLLAKACGLYGLPVLVAPRRHLARIFATWVGVLLALTLVLFLLKVGSVFSRGALVAFATFEITLLVVARFLMAKYLNSAMRAGTVRGRRAILLGDSSEFGAWGPAQLLRNFGIEEAARVAIGSWRPGSTALLPGELLNVDRAIEMARDGRADEIVVALEWSNTRRLDLVRDRLRKSPLPVRLLPCHVVRSVFDMGGVTNARPLMVELQRAPLSRAEQALKRAFDIVVATLCLVLLAPLLAIVASAIKCESRGPVIFRQRRNGFNGHRFVIFKFRTMKVLEDGATVIQARRDDQRVTRVGRLLRRWSIDELPQLLNVVKGDMSLVGPRPHALAHDAEYMELVGNYAFRHHVKPGITGWAQVNGYRGETPELEQMIERVEYDLWYIDNWSPWLDLRIALRTCFEVPRGGAY